MEREKNKAMHLYKMKSEDFATLLRQYNNLQRDFDILLKCNGERFMEAVIHNITTQITIDKV